MIELLWQQYLLIVLVFIWSGFVRSGLGFGGALFTIPFLLLIHNDPLFFLPIISIHLLFFASLTLLPKIGNSKHPLDKNVLIATILAQAFNYGNYKMSKTSDISYTALETTHQQYLRLATLKAANDIISNSIGKLKIFQYYSFDLELLYSSVDGQKYELDTPNVKGRYSKKYLREGPGVTAYTLSANHIPIQCELIGSHEHESYYVFDIWYNNTSDIQPDVITCIRLIKLILLFSIALALNLNHVLLALGINQKIFTVLQT